MHLNSPGSHPGSVLTEAVISSPSVSRRQPLLQRSKSPTYQETYFRGSTPEEICGGTAAACTAVCCCCPCGLLNLLVMVAYKVPTRLCKLARRRLDRRRMTKQGLLGTKKQEYPDFRHWVEGEFAIHPSDDNCLKRIQEENVAALELEKEMWNKFNGGGFWRSASQKENPTRRDHRIYESSELSSQKTNFVRSIERKDI